jgi:hypothetical protein
VHEFATLVLKLELALAHFNSRESQSICATLIRVTLIKEQLGAIVWTSFATFWVHERPPRVLKYELSHV